MEKVDFREFDILGIIELKDVHGIEKYVTPVVKDGKQEGYLSRSKEYYNVKTMTELALEREELITKITNERSKRNFVVLENILNCSAKVYFKKFEKYILSGKDKKEELQMKQAEACLLEDMNNLLTIFEENRDIQISPEKILPVGTENSERRAIEMDNKAILYLFLRTLKMKKNPEEVEVITPGYGSVYIGPMLNAMYGYNFTNIMKSKYISESKSEEEKSFSSVISSERIFEPNKTIFLLDDNIGTGNTMVELKNALNKEGISKPITGAIQYNWRNYYRVSIGEKTDIDRFDINEFDIISPFNYAGHKLYKHAIDTLHSSGEEYIEYLKSKNYRLKDISDMQGAIDRGVICAKYAGLEIAKGYNAPPRTSVQSAEILEKYRLSENKLTNPISRKIISDVISDVQEIEKIEENRDINIK